MNLFDNIPDTLPEELFTVLAEGEGVKVERIMSDGHASPAGFWYDQEQHEWILLLAGSAVLSLEKDNTFERIELTPGDHLLIPAHQRHRVESTASSEKTIWLAVFYS
ncbi:MAG: cupin domain-containing protein [Pontiellaceae bacterium]|nr:cupin domain-containing protein [Pontiellaceae bacterium]